MSAGAPICSSRPSLMMARRSATSIASSWSWVTKQRGHRDPGVQLAQPGPELLADLGVEGAERLVEQEHPRLDGQGPGQGHALALAAGELGGVAVGQVPDAHQIEQLVDPLPGPRPWDGARTSSPKATFRRTVRWRKGA